MSRNRGLPLKKRRFDDGWVYIAVHRGRPGIVKIGFTRRTPEQRVREWNEEGRLGFSSGLNLEYAVRVGDPIGLEKAMHKFFAARRLNKSDELFELDAIEAYEHMTYLCETRKTYRRLDLFHGPSTRKQANMERAKQEAEAQERVLRYDAFERIRKKIRTKALSEIALVTDTFWGRLFGFEEQSRINIVNSANAQIEAAGRQYNVPPHMWDEMEYQ